MTYYTAKDIAEGFRTVRRNTIAIAAEIPEPNYGFQAAPATRTIAQTLVHIAVMPRLAEQIHRIERLTTLEGFDFLAFMGAVIAEENVPRSKADILALLNGGEQFALWLESLSEDFLAERVIYPQGMVPPSKSRFEMLISAKEHEMHHRGQLMVAMRMLGMVPPLTRRMQEMIAAHQAASAKA